MAGLAKALNGKDNGAMTDADRDAEALRQAAADVDGSRPIAPVFSAEIPSINLKRLRKRLGLSQVDFAQKFGFTADSVRNWEQARRLPDRSTRILLRLIDRDPDAVAAAAAES